MWYVIQTITGKEQELVEAVGRVLAGEGQNYERCFVIYRENLRRSGGRLALWQEPMFPSYAFVETDRPIEFFQSLKQVPQLTRLLGMEGEFWSIYEEEENFLRYMLKESHRQPEEGREKEAMRYLVRRSLVQVDEEGRIIKAEGVLGHYLDRIVKQRLRKRSVVIELPFLGRMRRIQLGIRLLEDDREGL